MSFREFKTISAVLKEFQVRYDEANFVESLAFNISDYFQADLHLMMREGVVDNSEFAICENLIYPVLKEVWKQYRQHFILWSHQALTFDNHLTGFPEYILASRSPLGKIVFDKPYLLLVEAKQDNFEAAWAQCLAEMIAAQRLNQAAIPVFGITSNGSTWQFGKLTDELFTRNVLPYSIFELEALFGAVNYLFQQCEQQLRQYAMFS
ncbi:MAG: hypothetical protein NW220_09745 [Leptolyngbyaceae cyanobacterium bins.349]|nr:hypothetical protein [Leptolyngbyaceae cyanobacterium bins.349]